MAESESWKRYVCSRGEHLEELDFKLFKEFFSPYISTVMASMCMCIHKHAHRSSCLRSHNSRYSCTTGDGTTLCILRRGGNMVVPERKADREAPEWTQCQK